MKRILTTCITIGWALSNTVPCHARTVDELIQAVPQTSSTPALLALAASTMFVSSHLARGQALVAVKARRR
jgi:hypothetical protein